VDFFVDFGAMVGVFEGVLEGVEDFVRVGDVDGCGVLFVLFCSMVCQFFVNVGTKFWE